MLRGSVATSTVFALRGSSQRPVEVTETVRGLASAASAMRAPARSSRRARLRSFKPSSIAYRKCVDRMAALLPCWIRRTSGRMATSARSRRVLSRAASRLPPQTVLGVRSQVVGRVARGSASAVRRLSSASDLTRALLGRVNARPAETSTVTVDPSRITTRPMRTAEAPASPAAMVVSAQRTGIARVGSALRRSVGVPASTAYRTERRATSIVAEQGVQRASTDNGARAMRTACPSDVRAFAFHDRQVTPRWFSLRE